MPALPGWAKKNSFRGSFILQNKGNLAFPTGEEANLSNETIPNSIGPLCDDLLQFKDGPSHKFWCMSEY